jgi:class 3 adenylate cyclase
MMSVTVVHACGDDCRFALMSRFLATGSFELKGGSTPTMNARPVIKMGLRRPGLN